MRFKNHEINKKGRVNMIKKWFALPLLLLVLTLGACSQEEGKTGSGGEIEEGLEPLEERATVVIAEDGAASGAGFTLLMRWAILKTII